MPSEFDRRRIVTGLAASAGIAATGGWPRAAQAQSQPSLALKTAPATLQIDGRTLPAWTLDPPGPFRARRGDSLSFAMTNGLPVPVAINWHGLDGIAEVAPLTAIAQLASGATGRWTIPLRHAGTLLYDLHLLGDGQARPLPSGVVVVAEPDIVVADRDEVLLIEEWRLGADGPLAPGIAADDTPARFTVNSRASLDIPTTSGMRLRLRLLNGCQRSIVALKIEDHVVTVIAIDGQPSESFPARDGELILAPGTRIDVLVDTGNAPNSSSAILLHDGTTPRSIARIIYGTGEIARRAPLYAGPLPSNGLPDSLDLQRALRVALTFDGSKGDWSVPGELSAKSPAAFRARRGRTVVVTLTNRAAAPAVFHLHGHHARLLDRLDDGWKPFWLDTITVAGGQTQRIAFLAEYAGAWLIEGMLAQWSAPRLAQWFAIEA